MLADLSAIEHHLAEARRMTARLRTPRLAWALSSMDDAISDVRGYAREMQPERPILDAERVTLTSRELVG